MRVKNFFFIIIVLILIQGFCYSFGHKEKPEITVNTTGPQYLSPNDDGIDDTASFTFTVKIRIKSKEGYVPKYGIQLSNEAGEIVDEDINKEKSDVNPFAKIFRKYEDFTIDKEVAWDGKDKNGNVFPDGAYNTLLWVKDGAGNRSETPLEQFIIDTTPPEVTIEPEFSSFSPNGDGNQDTLVINHSGTAEAKWEGVIKDGEGNTILSKTWTDAAPGEMIWDGKLPDGTLAPDGTYVYTITGTDLVGNTASFTSDALVLDTRETPINLTLSNPSISPNDDGLYDDITFYPVVDDTEGLLNWKISIVDMDGNAMKTIQSEGSTLENEVLYDGTDDSGNFLPHGDYQAVFEVKYNQGNNPAVSVPMAVDLEPPQYDVVIENPYFSPNGDGYGDVLLVKMVSDEEISWTGDVLDKDGNEIKDVGVDEPSTEISWDGMDNSGNIQPEGMYTLSLHITDRAGNWAMFSGGEMYIDFTPPETYISLNTTLFSPNRDGQKDTVGIEIITNEPVTGNCIVKDSDGHDVQYVSVLQEMTVVEWDGTDESGAVVPDGTYTIEGVLSDLAGNNITTESHSVSTDTRSTKVSVTVPGGFSPNGDSIDDILVIGLGAELEEGITGWNLFIEGTPGVPVKTFTGGSNLPAVLEWDGIDEMDLVREGSYTAKLRVEYLKGDISEGVSRRFNLDVSPPEIGLNVEKGKAEDEDPLAEELFITMDIKDDSEIMEWDLDIVNYEGDIIRSYGGEGDPSDQIAWNAAGNNDKPVPPEDQYTIVVRVTDVYGNNSQHKETLPLDLLIARIGDKYYLIVPNIIFGKYQYKLDSAGKKMYQRNVASLKKAADIYKMFPQYKVGLEGHALDIYLHKGKAAMDKEEKILVPLTRNRALTVKNALVKEGIDKDRIQTKWFGGKYPIVSVEDRKVYWKNRRVEFLLVKPEQEEPEEE